MKKIIISLIFTTQLVCAKQNQEAFIKQNILPYSELKTLLDESFFKNKDIKKSLAAAGFEFIKTENQIVAKHPMFPVIVKAIPQKSYKRTFISDTLNVGRVEMANQIASLIKENNLNCLVVPKKWLYHIPNKKLELSDENYMVVAEKIDITNEETNKMLWQFSTVSEAQSIKKIIKSLGFLDATFDNLRFTKDGKIAFIDTEPRWKIDFIDKIGLNGIRKKILASKGLNKFLTNLSKAKSHNI